MTRYFPEYLTDIIKNNKIIMTQTPRPNKPTPLRVLATLNSSLEA